jgi:hypothetical protein
MIASLVDLLFGCSHSNYSFPQTVKAGHSRPAAAAVTGTYIVCLDCGKEFPYDWRSMKVVSAAAQPQEQGDMAEVIPFARKNAA